MNASEWIKKFNEAQTDEEIMNLWVGLTSQSPRTSSGAWDHENDNVTREVHKAVKAKLTEAISRHFSDELRQRRILRLHENSINTPEV